MNLFIKGIRFKEFENNNEYPYNINSIRNIKKIDFLKNVTMIVGDNGVGKSTLIEAIAISYGFNPEGGSKNLNFETKSTHSNLYKEIILEKLRYSKDGYFFRGETFYNVASNIDDLVQDGFRSLLNSYGGKSLHEQSHGESNSH